jgi:hypothetical protein
MADVLMTNKSLSTLDFGSNRITDDSGKALVAALKVNVTCRFFGIQDNPMSDTVKSEISYFVGLNNAGRQLRGYNVPKGLWAHLLSRSNQEERQQQDVIYHILRSKPELVFCAGHGIHSEQL